MEASRYFDIEAVVSRFLTASLSILVTLTGVRYKLQWEYQRATEMICHWLRKAFCTTRETFHIIVKKISQKGFVLHQAMSSF